MTAPASQPAQPLPGTVSDYHGFDMHTFTAAGLKCLVVAPKQVAAGTPWIWRAEFFDHRPELDLALLGKGFHLAYIEVGNTFGCPDAMAKWDEFYTLLVTKHGLSPRPAMEGLSRGGLYIYNWAAAHPDRVSVLYGDNPVCDFKSWPGGKGKGPGSPDDWRKLIRDYHFKDEAEAMAYKKNPVDNLAPLAGDAGHETAKALLGQGCGGIVGFVVKGGTPAVDTFRAHLKLCRPWVSLGDTGTLVYCRPPEPRKGIPEGFVRLSVGLEDVADIISDLDQALTASRT